MKLLYIYDEMPKTYQKYMLYLLEELKKKTPLKVLTYKEDENTDYSVKSYGVRDNLQRLASKTKLVKEKSLDIKIMNEFDIVHLQHSYLFNKFQPFFNVNIKGKPKIVITLRGGDTYIKPWTTKKWQDLYKTNSKYISAFITVSKHQKEYLQKWGVSANKIHVIPISFGDKTCAQPKPPSDKTINIVSAHRMCWEKNIAGNLHVIKALKEKGKSVKYDIYGDGPDAGQVYYLIDKYDLDKEVNFIGKIDNSIFKERLADYDFFLQLSHSESFGASVIEAQSKGVPAIISNSGGLPETILEDKSGVCVDAWDIEKASSAIIDIFSDKEKYIQFSERAITHCNQHFTIEHEVKLLLELYKSIY